MSLNVEKHIAYWRDGAEEDFDVAKELFGNGRYRYALFFAHLAVEKMLKAHVAKKMREYPPKIHNLLRLVQLADLSIDKEHMNTLKRLNAYQIEGRYPEVSSAYDRSERPDSGNTEGNRMVEESIVKTLRQYVAALPKFGVHPQRVVLYGSFATGKAHEWSDIDVVVIAPEFDENRNMETVEKLWLATADADNRIEPIACGMREWESDSPRPILAIARREGIEITA